MNVEAATIWNLAIEAAVKEYPKGIGAIQELKKKFIITVDHIGTTSRQEVVIKDE